MYVATASTTVKFHEFPSGTVAYNYQPGTQVDGSIRSISWSKDGNWLALVPNSGQAEIVSVRDQLKLLQTIQGIEKPSCASFQNTTKKNIAVGTKSGQVLIYDIKARAVKKRYPTAMSAVTHVEFTTKDNHLVAACGSGEVFLYSNVTNHLSGTFRIPKSQSVSALSTNPIKRNFVAAGSNEGVVAVWDINASKTKLFVESHKAPVTAVKFSPINSDLVLSAGLDRQFCFYDAGAGKCIANNFVDNNTTALDFSPDGRFIAMASQRGRVHVYDSRSFKEPMHSFAAHNSSIRHLAFRKSEDSDSSVCSGILEAPKQQQQQQEEAKHSRHNSEFFGICAISHGEASKSSGDAGDSFMAEMGLDRNSTVGSAKNDSYPRAPEQIKKFTLKATPTNPSRILQEKLHEKTPKSSTPNYPSQDLSLLSPIPCPKVEALQHQTSEISPIPCLQQDTLQSQSKAVAESVEAMMKTVRGEMKAMAEELRKEIKYQSTHILSETQQMYLNLVMVMVKESIKVENNFNSLRTDLTYDLPQNQGSLYEENLLLKQKLAAVEQELSVLRANEANKNYS